MSESLNYLSFQTGSKCFLISSKMDSSQIQKLKAFPVIFSWSRQKCDRDTWMTLVPAEQIGSESWESNAPALWPLLLTLVHEYVLIMPIRLKFSKKFPLRSFLLCFFFFYFTLHFFYSYFIIILKVMTNYLFMTSGNNMWSSIMA